MVEHYRRLVAGINVDDMQQADGRWAQDMLTRLQDVPITQPAHAAVQLRNLLELMLASRCDGRARSRVLERLQDHTRTLTDGLLEHIAAEGHPLPVAKANLAGLLLEVASLHAQNACVVVWELAAPKGRVPRIGAGRVIQALNQAVDQLHQVLALSFQQYAEPPAGCWQRLHAMYGFAEAAGVAHRRRSALGEGVARSVRQRYAHALLLSMANPWGMQRAELRAADVACAGLAGRARFGTGDMAVPVHGSDPDSGPGHASARAVAEDIPRLDLGPVLELLDQQLASTPAETHTVGFGDGHGHQVEVRRGLLDRMVRSWRGRLQRDFNRIPGTRPMALLLGMRGIHQALTGGMDFVAFREHLAGGQLPASLADSPAAWLSAHPAATPQHVQARVIDQSRGGYCLWWHGEQNHRVRVGELVGLIPGSIDAAADNASGIMWLGVLRWLRSMPGGRLVVGVELVAHTLEAAMVRVHDRAQQRWPLQRGVLLDVDGEAPELVLERLRGSAVSTVEIAWSGAAGASDEASTRRRRVEVRQVSELSSAYYRLALSDRQGEAP